MPHTSLSVVNILHCKFCRLMLCGIDNSKDVQELIYTTRLKIVSKEDFLKNNGKPLTRISGIRKTRSVSPNVGSIPTPLLHLLHPCLLSLLTARLCLKCLNQIVTHKPITNVAAEIAIPIIPPEKSDELELFEDGVADGRLLYQNSRCLFGLEIDC
jgi:hypothetical protein